MDSTTTTQNKPQPPPPPPKMEQQQELVANSKPKTPIPLSFSNGALKKHTPIPRPLPQQHHTYRECLKNHAASLGGHALDGCGEFMPSPSFNPSDPSSLTCAACGCHRNFHRRLSTIHYPDEDDDADADADDDADDYHISSAPHMLMALSDAHRPEGGPRKRFRTRFSPEQKERMQELSERLGWRLQKRDEKVVEDWCREIGVGKGVFKVWMHNNKHNFTARAARAAGTMDSTGTVVGYNGNTVRDEGMDEHVHVVVANGSSTPPPHASLLPR